MGVIAMRTLILAGAAALTLAVPAALNAQGTPAPSADQANARQEPAPKTTTVTSNVAGQTVVTASNPGNLTPPPAQAMNKVYPLCTRRLQDNCQNPGEGGAPGKSRALGYWPGESATERRERGG
jgi:hypothetical protein